MTGIRGQTGVAYTLDHETGEFLRATATIARNVINDIDGATGAVTESSELVCTDLGQEVLSCPSRGGGAWSRYARGRGGPRRSSGRTSAPSAARRSRNSRTCGSSAARGAPPPRRLAHGAAHAHNPAKRECPLP